MSIVVPFLGYLLFIASSIKKQYVHCSSFVGLPSNYSILNKKKTMSIVVPFLGYLLTIGSSIKTICPL